MREQIKVVHKKLGKQKVNGLAHFNTNTIEIDSRLTGKKHLEIVIHEVYHLHQPNLTEKEIEEQSIQLTKILWDLGYRRVDNDESEQLQDGSF